MNQTKLHEIINLSFSILFSPIYLPHIILFYSNKTIQKKVISDLKRYNRNLTISFHKLLQLIYHLHNNSAFRKLFYHRFGIAGYLISWIRPGLNSLLISRTMPIGEGCYLVHPESTILSAKSIGNNFSCIQLTTLGKTKYGSPTIGDNVTLGANVTIVGHIRIGNNVIVGAGSVVVKDIPDNVIVAGVPAKIIKYIDIK